MSDVIEIPHIALMVRVGLSEAERATPQPLVIGVRLTLNVERGLHDDLAGTFDYSLLDRVIPAALEPAPKLLETLAERITVGIMEETEYSRIDTIEISVTKCQPPISLTSDGVTVTLVTRGSHDSEAAQR
ncbi:dihydroneopterin aldolase [Ferrimicrobium sp.]|uniref:dihydroneopterin aldolase n=1 Tax=Ferrimicrobium sp. TaxID=2926050 RepID=UPI002609BB02|nr:dihydroneopterin aldolase [Ferrimicrobium sp.]